MKFVSLTWALILFLPTCSWADAPPFEKFFGHYVGEVTLSDNRLRKLDVTISEARKSGFNVSWKTVSLDELGSGKVKSYSIDFLPSDREGIYGSAMKTNLFGGQQPLDPLKGEPYFWSRVSGDVLTVYGMLIRPDGGYEIQRYDRKLSGDTMDASYTLFSEGESVKQINATLQRN